MQLGTHRIISTVALARMYLYSYGGRGVSQRNAVDGRRNVSIDPCIVMLGQQYLAVGHTKGPCKNGQTQDQLSICAGLAHVDGSICRLSIANLPNRTYLTFSVCERAMYALSLEAGEESLDVSPRGLSLSVLLPRELQNLIGAQSTPRRISKCL